MITTGVIVEYNPLHNGHIYHLTQTRKITHCDLIVAVMSGNFVQRGEPSFVNKWARTKMALLSGVDLVVELPLLNSISSAEGFAFGAVSILNMLGVDYVCFGSECGNIELLSSLANILTQEPTSYKSFLHEELKSGNSFPKARQNALINYIITKKYKNVNSDIINKVLQSSNNILGIEYLKAMNNSSSKIKPITIGRVANNYKDKELSADISSATSIRHNFSHREHVERSIPGYTSDIIHDEELNGRGPIYLSDFSDLILYKIRHMSVDELYNILDVEIGLNHSLKRMAEDSCNISEMLIKLKSKRYTSTRLQRILLYILFGITKEAKDKVKTPPEYIRVLGFNLKGRELIRQLKKTSDLKIITNPSSSEAELLKYDILATDTYVLGYHNNKFKFGKQDLKLPPVIFD